MTGGQSFARRDRVVCAVCNLLLNHVASRRYRAVVAGIIRSGLDAAVRDEPAAGSIGYEMDPLSYPRAVFPSAEVVAEDWARRRGAR